MIRFGLVIAFVFTSFLGQAQQINFGVVGGFNLYQKIKWDKAIHVPKNSYMTYVENQYGEGLLNKNSVLNGLNYGVSIEARYKRFSVNIEPQFYYQRSYLLFEKPFYIERIIGKRAFRMPVFATVNLFKGTKSPFLLLGLNFIKERTWDFHSPSFEYYNQDGEQFETQFETGTGHFEGALYDNRAYLNYVAGVGKSGKRWDASLRFQQELKLTKHDIEANIWQIELVFNFRIISTRDFTKKHFLYVE